MTLAADAPREEPPPARHVLVLYSSFRGLAPYEEFERHLSARLRLDADERTDVLSEYLDLTRYSLPEYQSAVADYLEAKYAGTRIDVVVPVSAAALQFVAARRNELFPDAAIVFGAIDQKVVAALTVPPGITGVVSHVDIPGTVALALQLQPETEHIAVVNGSSQLERSWNKRLFAEVALQAGGRDIIDLTGLRVSDIRDRLATLPDRTIVLWGSMWVDADGITFAPDSLVSEMSGASRGAMYGLFDNVLGHGVVGGRIASYARAGDETATVVRRVLSGESPGTIPIVDVGESPTIVDWRELRRWRIDDRTLPAGAIVEFREPTFWERYRWEILLISGVVLVETLLLVALITQRTLLRRSQRALADRLSFERLVSDITARFADVSPEHAAEAFRDALESLRVQLRVDRASLILFAGERSPMRVEHTSVAEGVRPMPATIDPATVPGVIASLDRGESVAIANMSDDARVGAEDRETFLRGDIHSYFATPLHASGETLGFLALSTLQSYRDWSESLSHRLQTLANVFASALLRVRAAEALRSSEALSHAVLSSVSALVAVVDARGSIIAVNASWKRRERDATRLMGSRAGANYLEACDEAFAAGDAAAGRVADGLRKVIEGSLPDFSCELEAAGGEPGRWYQLTIEPLDRADGGAVISYLDITERRSAEIEADERRKQLAHVARVSTMGELAASIAHELNQPLTGVLTNAQAAQRFLAADPPDLDEVREILADIVEDDRRAGEVIRRLRRMLRSGSVERSAIDVNSLVSDVVKFVASDAAMRRVRIEPRLAGGLAEIEGDRVQLQQVLLNLVINGMDAMRATPEAQRLLTIATRPGSGSSAVEIVVCDSGTGIGDEHARELFKPFFTTKEDGLGIGLSVARTIIEVHGGQVVARNNDGPGASFVVSLPAASKPAGREQADATSAD